MHLDRFHWFLAGVVLAALGTARRAPAVESTLVPVPYVTTGPTTGVEYGTIFALLRQEDGRNVSISAPSVAYGDIFGLTGTFRHYWFPEDTEKLTFLASAGTKGEQYYIFRYNNLDVLNRTYSVDAEIAYQRLITWRFYGIGATSAEHDETSYTREELGGSLRLGGYLTRDLRLMLQQRLQKVNNLRGELELPEPEQLFPETFGLDGGFLAATRVALLYDDRDSPDIPNEGMYGEVFGEIAVEDLLGDFSFQRLGAEARLYLSGPSRRFVTAFRVLSEYVTGDSIPFYELSRLGGASQLRGFAENRFADEGKVLASIEERIRFLDVTLFDVFTQLELAVFGDFGKVFSSTDHFLDDFQAVGGVGLRFIVPPTIVATVDLGVGSEGAAAFAVLGYPF